MGEGTSILIAMTMQTATSVRTDPSVLVVTRSWDTTANAVIHELQAAGTSVTRLNTEEFPKTAALEILLGTQDEQARLQFEDGRSIAAEHVTAVYYRRPDPPLIDESVRDPVMREFAQNESKSALSGFLRLLRSRWVNHPSAIAEAELKVLQLRVAREVGFLVPATCITNNPSVARDFFHANGGRVVAKTLRSPLVSLAPSLMVYTSLLSASDLEAFDSIRLAPCILQQLVEVAVELRVTVVGTHLFVAEIAAPPGQVDWRRTESSATPIRHHQLPESISNLCIALVSKFGLRFGALDLILDTQGRYTFLELNPNGEWGWLSQVFGNEIAVALADELSAYNPDY